MSVIILERAWIPAAGGRDIRKVDGDDPADAARYGLVSGGRIAGVGPAFVPSRAGQAPPFHQPLNTPHFVTGMPLGEAFQRQMAAPQGLSGLFGVDSNLLGRTLGIPAELLNVRSSASRSNGGGFFSALDSGLGSTLGAPPGAFF
jgi:hypothetical protein